MWNMSSITDNFDIGRKLGIAEIKVFRRVDAFELRTVAEDRSTNFHYGAGNADLFEFGTSFEGIITDYSDGIGNADLRE